MSNPNPSSFLGNVHWMLAKKIENNDFNNIFHTSTTIPVSLFEILEMLPGICLAYIIKCYPSTLVWQIQIDQHF